MLEYALKSRLPLIQINTGDTVNIADVVASYIPEETLELYDRDTITHYTYSINFGGEQVENWDKLYNACLGKEATVIIVNPEEDIPQAFQINEVIVPISLIEEMTQSLMGASPEDIVSLMRGVSLKDIHALLSITLAEHGQVSKENLLRTKAKLFSGTTSGLYSVDSEMEFYAEESALTHWLDENEYFFTEYTGPLQNRLRPRGLLLNGPPGVGKTVGAKFLAEKFGVPLFRLDIGTIMQKYVGESERRLDASLVRIEHEAPCVVLLDEVEKLFADEDGGVGSRLLAKLLWWLQEHKSVVLTVMTCNDLEVIPSELYRSGRIDEVIQLTKMGRPLALWFVSEMLQSLGCIYTKKTCAEIVGTVSKEGISHADAVQKVHSYLKRLLKFQEEDQ